jgi:hypothetical protein
MGESQRILKLTLYIDDKVPERKVTEIDDLISRLREEISFISDWDQTLFGCWLGIYECFYSLIGKGGRAAECARLESG